MAARKIIPCLDTKDGQVVKGVKFEDLSTIGNPADLALKYENQGADEITLLDISATVEGRNTVLDLITKVSGKISIPLAVGGGIGSVNDVARVLDAGADKASINSAAVRKPTLITECAERFGTEAIIVAIDVVKSHDGWSVCISGGNEIVDLDAIEWAKEVEELGAGEILLTSKDADGVKEGYDIPLTAAIAKAVSIPVTASGGCGSMEHIYEVFSKTDAKSALAASIFHYGDCTVSEVKDYLRSKGMKI